MAFDVFDRDKNGGICQNELKFILGEYNANAKDYLWKKMIEQIDLNKDGQISYDEFHKMMMEVINNKNKRKSMMEIKSYRNNKNININTVSNEIDKDYKETEIEDKLKEKRENNKLGIYRKRNKSVFMNTKNIIKEE